MPYWSSRWRRGIVTKNWHWHAAMLARFGNWFIGRGFKTDAEYWRDQDRAIKQGSSQVVSGKPTQHAAGSTQVKKRKLNLCKKCGYTKSHPVHIRLCLGIYN